MTSPLGSAGGGSPSSISVGGQPDFGLILQALQASKARKQRQAETALSLVTPGAKFSELSPDAQKSVQRATGRKWQPDEVVSPLPLTQDEAATNRLITGLGLAPNSTLAMGLKGALASKIATGKPGELATPEELTKRQLDAAATAEEERKLGGTVAAAKQTEAEATASEATAFKSAVGKISAAGGAGGTQPELTQAEIAAYQHFNNFVPSQAVSDQFSGLARAEIMKQGVRLAADPNSASFAKVLKPLGVTPADAIGAFALGIGGVLDVAINRKSQLELAAATREGNIAEIAARAMYGSAEDISKRLGGAYSPDFISQVMAGDPKAIGTPAGQMVQRFTSAGFMTALTEQAVKGDPAALSMKQLMDLGRIPQIASNEKLLTQYSNLVQQSLAATLTRTFTGMDRPTEAGDDQKKWDTVQATMMKKTAGVFSTPTGAKGMLPGFLGGNDITITPQGKGTDVPGQAGASDATGTKANDSKIVSDALQALFGNVSAPAQLAVPKKAIPPATPIAPAGGAP